jgi:hypothetical protein
MLRRTKIIIIAYCAGGLVFLAMAVGLVWQYTDWLGRPERYSEFTHDHQHHADEQTSPETSPATTYEADGKTYVKVPRQDEDFDVTQRCVDLKQVLEVGLRPEKFPDLEELKFILAEDSPLPDGDGVLGVSIAGEEKTYPIRMLNYHVVLNDVCGGKEVAVVWDPLTLTPKVFHRITKLGEGQELAITFGKLALVHNGGLLLYDKQTRSLWWPPEGKCLAGKLSGTVLGQYSFLLVSWETWRTRHPRTVVLSTDTPYEREYHRDFYSPYYAMRRLPLPVEGWSDRESRFGWSEPMIALEREGKAKAYPMTVLNEIRGDFEDTFASERIVFQAPTSGPRYPTDENGGQIPYSFGAWFLWSVRYPDIELYFSESETR